MIHGKGLPWWRKGLRDRIGAGSEQVAGMKGLGDWEKGFMGIEVLGLVQRIAKYTIILSAPSSDECTFIQ
jgi:hypothetical protein